MRQIRNDEKENLLQLILERFDQANKETLAVELVESFVLLQNGPPYQKQIAEILDRELSITEEFKLTVLNAAHNLIGGGAAVEYERDE